MFTILRSNHWILIVLVPKERKAYYMDSLKTQARLDTKLIEPVLNDALNRFSCMAGSNLPKSGNGPGQTDKFVHVTNIGCVQQPKSTMYVEYYLCWHMDTLVWFQNQVRKAEVFEKYCSDIEKAEFDYKLEFTRIQKIFATVINKEVIEDTGLFYYGDDTPPNSRKQGLHLSSQVGPP